MTEVAQPASFIVLHVWGPPIGKARPRFVKATGRAFTPAATERAENRVQLAWIDAGRPRLADGPIIATVEAVFVRPQGHWKRDGTLSAAGERAPWPVKRPDGDNLLKLVADALNRCAYHDDAQLVDSRVVKRWANPGEDEHLTVMLGPATAPVLMDHARALSEQGRAA